MASAERTGAQTSHRVVIVGGGFAGLYAAKALRYAQVQVTVIDRTNYHLFQPMLYQAATAQLSGDDIAGPIRGILADQKNTTVLMDEVVGIDVDSRRVATRNGSHEYDSLVVASGSEYNYFGHDDWRSLAPSLKTLSDASAIRQSILSGFERAERSSSDSALQDATVVLVGGGPTGVELAGAIAELTHGSLCGDFRHIDPSRARIVLVEGGKRLLGGFDEELAEAARRKLIELGVEIRLGAKVSQISRGGVEVAGEHIDAATVVWTAGVKGSAAAQWLGAPTDSQGRVIVGPDLTLPGHPEIFVIGDTACVHAGRTNIFGAALASDPAQALPGLAQPAIQEGRYAACVIRRRQRRLAAPPPFVYRDKGNLAAVGRSFAIADLGKVRLAGLPAWIVWLVVHIAFLIGFANRLQVLLDWAIVYFSGERTGRIIAPSPAPSASPPAHQ